MPRLKNTQWEKFAQLVARGTTIEASYSGAGYIHNPANASRLKANEKVSARIAELQERSAEKVAVTAASIVEELDAIAEAAQKRGQNAAAVAAVMGKAKVLGLIIDRREQGDPGAFDAMEEGDLERSAGDKARALGLKVVDAA